MRILKYKHNSGYPVKVKCLLSSYLLKKLHVPAVTLFSIILLCSGCGDEFGILLTDYINPETSVVQASPTNYSFGNVWAQGSYERVYTFTLNNTSEDPVEIYSPGLSDNVNYYIVTDPASTINPGSSTTIEIKFDPGSVGIKPAVVIIAHNHEGSPLIINVSGTGIGEILWTETDQTINCVNKDRTGSQALLTVSGIPLDIEVYSPGNQIYWTEYYDAKYQIKKADSDGTDVEIFAGYPATAFHGPTTLAIDEANGQLYWSMHNTGSSNNTIFYTGLSTFTQNTWREITYSYYTYGLCLDTLNNQLYFTDNTYWDVSTPVGIGYTGIAGHGTLDDNGASFETPLNISNSPGPSSILRDIAADGTNHRIFYVLNDAAGVSIIKARDDFQEIEEWIPAQANGIRKIALDLTARKIYWTTDTGNYIYRADLDTPNSNIELFLSLDSKPNGIAIVP